MILLMKDHQRNNRILKKPLNSVRSLFCFVMFVDLFVFAYLLCKCLYVLHYFGIRFAFLMFPLRFYSFVLRLVVFSFISFQLLGGYMLFRVCWFLFVLALVHVSQVLDGLDACIVYFPREV